MRFGHYLVVLLALATAADASEWRDPVDLPPGGLLVILPGFTFPSPGKGWQMMSNLPPQKTVIYGDMHMGFHLPAMGTEENTDPSETYAHVTAASDDWLDEVTTTEAFDAAMKATAESYLAYERKSDPKATMSFDRRSIEGGYCLGWRITSEMANANALAIFNSSPRLGFSGVLSCIHDRNPLFRMSFEYDVSWEKGTQPLGAAMEGVTALDQLKILPVAFRAQSVAVAGYGMRMVDADGAIWATYHDFPTDTERPVRQGGVLRIDPKTMAVTARIPVNGLPFAIAAAVDGIWIANGARLQRIDSKANRLSQTIRLPRTVNKVTAGGGFLWALCQSGSKDSGGQTVFRVDPKTGGSEEIPQPGGHPRQLIFAESKLHIDVGRALMIFDPQSLKLIGSRSVEEGMLSYDGRYLWNIVVTDSFVPVSQSPDRRLHGKPFTIKLDRIDLSAAQEAPLTLARYTAPTLIPPGGSVWWGRRFCMLVNDAVICIEPGAPEKPAEIIPCEGIFFGDMLVANGSLWVMRGHGHSILRIDPK